ncbi:MAG: hypothetical protein H6581_07835 [Bacteroidia bacterium]|nr:hypothetical protein [Bacteroidia bacterium]
MRPELKISELTNLHDARYCAAVGIFLQAFSLERGNSKKVSVEVIREIRPWLSGPELIGEYGYDDPAEIKSDLEVVELEHISVPLDYPRENLAHLPGKLIFRSQENLRSGSAGLTLIQETAAKFPSALFEISLDSMEDSLWDDLAALGLTERCILKFQDPDPIWHLLQKKGVRPFAFSLGPWVEESSGELDYEFCDEFIGKFNELLPVS